MLVIFELLVVMKYKLLSNFVTFGENLTFKDRTNQHNVLELSLVNHVLHSVIFNYMLFNHTISRMY